jgi:small subunit ribosomal protein S11e
MEHQTEKAFQKQAGIFQNSKDAKKRNKRWFKEVGNGFKTPKEAKVGTYIDKKCPFVGEVNIQGHILTGVVVSTKMKRTLVVRRDYLHYIPKLKLETWLCLIDLVNKVVRAQRKVFVIFKNLLRSV